MARQKKSPPPPAAPAAAVESAANISVDAGLDGAAGADQKPEVGGQKSAGEQPAAQPEISKLTEAEKYAVRIAALAFQYYNPTEGRRTSREEFQELVAAGIIKASAPLDGDEVAGQEGVAQAINKEFPGANVHQVYVSAWLKGKQLPRGVPPMPPGHASGRFRRSVFLPWYREHFSKKGQGTPAQPEDNRAKSERLRAEREEFELAELRKEKGNKYIERAAAAASVSGALKLHHSYAKKAFEKTLKGGVALQFANDGFTPAQMQRITDGFGLLGRAIIQGVEEDCAKF